VISSLRLSWRPVTSGIPQGLILRPTVFNIFINNLCDKTDCALSKLEVIQNGEKWLIHQMDVLLLGAGKLTGWTNGPTETT